MEQPVYPASHGPAFNLASGPAGAWGNPEQVMAGIRHHLDAGADHVRVGTIAPDFQAALESLERLTPALAR